ncbi:Ig-like domain-containing protein [Tateyamaria sp.]|nr:Ig-like domain-containing protein [Tateyamaria sp.]
MYISFDATDNGNGQTTSYDYRLEHPSTFTYDINTAPTANAGSAAAVTSGTQVTLTGSGTDTDGTIASYAWTRTGGTGTATNATLSDATAAQPTFTDSSLTSNDSLVTHVFELVVTDDDGAASSADSVTITINPPDNTAPTANAGSAAAVTSGTQVTLSGSGTDTDGTIASYAWTRTGGTGTATNATLSDAAAAQPTFTDSSLTSNDSLVTHVFELVVTDDDGAASSADSVTITINPPDVTPPEPPKAENTAVVINPDDSITVSGTGAEPGATVKVIFPDGSVGSTVVKTQLVSLGENSFSVTESSGTYSVTSGPEQPSGTVRVVLVDAAGNASDALVHNIDTTAPDAPTAQNTTVTVNADSSVTVSGTDAEVDATARVTFPDGSVVEATVAGDGTYSVTSGPEQPSGTVRVVLVDAAGNTSDALVHNIDTTAPDAPTAQNTTVTVNADSSVTVSGTDAEVDATARVTFPDGSVVEATVAGDGTYSVTSGPEQPSGTVKVVLLDAAGNASDALELRFVGVPTVAQIQTEIATYMQTRAGFVLAAQPDLIGFLSGNVTGALNAFVTKRNGTFNFATSGDDFGSPKKLPFWVRMQGNWSDNGQHKNSYYFGAVGAHRFLSPNAIAGLTLQYDLLKQQDGNTTTKGVGYLVGPYIIAKFPEQPLYFEGRYLFGETDNSVSIDGGPPQNFKTDLSLLSFKIAGKLHYGDFTLTPSLTATHLEDKQDAFIDNYGRSVAEQGISMTDVALGLDFAKTLDVSNGRLLLTGGIAGVWSDTDGSGFASTITPKFDGQRARIRLGATYSLDGGMALSVGVNYDGIGVDNYESFSISFGLNAEF